MELVPSNVMFARCSLM